MSSMLLAAAAAAASQAPAVTADQAMAVEKALVSPAPPRRTVDCPQASGREIVVCGRREEDPAKQYVPSDIDSGVPDDLPQVPPVTMLPSCAAATVCAQHLGPKPRQLYIIDLKAIPEPPAGSDADRMAKGEIPTP